MANGLQSFNRAITNPSTQKYLQDVLGDRKGSFVNNLTALVANNDNLQVCEPYTLMFAAMKATSLNLPLENSLGYAYVIPFKQKVKDPESKKVVGEKTVAQFQLGYKGLKQLAIRTNQYKIINATDVREGEIVGRNRLTGQIDFKFIEDDQARLNAKIIRYVSYFKLDGGFESTFYMSRDEMENHAKRYSQTYASKLDYIRNSSKWTTDFDAMALKTVTKLNISKNGPTSVELNDAIKADQSVMYKENEYEYVDNGEINEIDEAKAQAVADKFADFEVAE